MIPSVQKPNYRIDRGNCENLQRYRFASWVKGRFPFTKNFGKFLLGILGISVWEESVPFVTSPIRLQAPLRRFAKKPDALVNCSAIFSNASLFVAFRSNKWFILSACVVIRSLASACSRRSRFTVIETSPVNERTFQSCSCNNLIFKHNMHRQRKLRTSKNFYLPLLYKAHSCCNKFPWSDARTYPGYQRFFSRCTSFVRPKADTGNRARKTSGTQGS